METDFHSSVVDGKLQFKHAPAAKRKMPQASNNKMVFKRRDMSRHELVSAQNHAEDMVVPLTVNVFITRHKAFSIKCYKTVSHSTTMLETQ